MKNKGEKGSITLFVTVSCFFIMAMLITFVMSVENKKQAQNREINQIIRNYEVDNSEMEQIYSKIVNQDQS